MRNRHKRYSILLLGLAVLLASSMVACTQPTPVSPVPPATSGEVLIVDYFNITRLGSGYESSCFQKYFEVNLKTASEEELDEALDEFHSNMELPFNDCGIYYSDYFFLRTSESVHIIIESKVPISTDALDSTGCDFFNGTMVLFIENDGQDYSAKSCDGRRVSNKWNNWETVVVFSPDIDGRYQLLFLNNSGKSCWCKYSVSLIQ